MKLKLKLWQRFLKDRWSGSKFACAKEKIDMEFSIMLSQPIKVAYLYENKIENLSRASKQINEVIIKPGEIFSFWKIIGEPNEENGYKKGRNIVSGMMSEEFGGGLCQLSGILYHISLMAGLEIVERYNHSVDFYTDENRYTPIGCDATVVYGYKDLRIKNNFNFPIQFYVETEMDKLIARLKSQKFIAERKILFDKNESESSIEVCLRTEQGIIINRSVYSKFSS